MTPRSPKACLTAALLLVLATPTIARAAPGDLDPSFDADGRVTTSFTPSPDFGNAVAIQPDGKIVVVGSAPAGMGNEFAVARYNVDGSLDTTFDGDGKVTTPVGAGNAAEAWALAIDAGGRIVVAGPAANATDNDFGLVRYNADGSLDSSFDGDGKVVTAIGTGVDEAWGLAIQADGKIVLAGSSWNGPVADFALARYNADGSLDTSFNGDGKLTTPVGAGVAVAYGVRVQPDGKIVAAGYSSNGTNEDFALVRYNADGSLDTGFDGDGIVMTEVGTGNEQAWALVLQPDGKVVAGGYSSNGADDDFALVRYSADGSLDASFDGDGKATTNFSGNDYVAGLAVEGNGKIVAGGDTDSAVFPGNGNFALARYNANGSLDSSFGTGGTVMTSFGSVDYGRSVAIQPDGKIVLAGSGVGGGQTAFAVARYLGDPEPEGPAPDSVAPTNPTLASPDHTAGVWSNDSTVSIAFSGASDASGVDGFSFIWDTNATTIPDTIKDAEEDATSATSPELPDGSHYFHLRTVDSAGNWSGAVHVGPFLIDTAAPASAVGGPALTRHFNTQRSLHLSWTASEEASGVRSYDVRYRRAPLAAGFRRAVMWKSGAGATAGALGALPGSTYCVSAKASDVAGNAGEFSRERCTAIPADDRQLSRRGRWRRGLGRGHYLRSFSASKTRGAALLVRVAAKRLSLVATRCRRCGAVDVYLGSKRLRRIELEASRRRVRSIIPIASFRRLRRGTVRIAVASRRELVLIDGLGASRE